MTKKYNIRAVKWKTPRLGAEDYKVQGRHGWQLILCGQLANGLYVGVADGDRGWYNRSGDRFECGYRMLPTDGQHPTLVVFLNFSNVSNNNDAQKNQSFTSLGLSRWRRS